MRVFLALCFIFVLVQFSIAQHNDFYSKVSEFKKGTLSQLIALDIESKTYKGRVIIEKGDLYVFLIREKNLDEKGYELFMKDLLTNKKTLYVCNLKIEESDFIPVKEVEEVMNLGAKGKKEFLNHFFRGRFMKSEILLESKSFDVMYAVANKLFEWNIIIYQDDVTGLLAIWDYENLK